jgi:SulP family sulfate permease
MQAAAALKPAWFASVPRNVLSGFVVGMVALPLSMAFAIASGARPEQGLYTAIVAGTVSALAGGSRVQISGPTGALVVILAGIHARYGFAGVQLAGILAGILLLLLGAARLGSFVKYIPYPVVAGFTAGIGILIFVGQWANFFGLEAAPEGLFHEKLWYLVQALPDLHPATTLLSLGACALVIAAPRFAPRVPAPLLAMLGATAVQANFQFAGVATVGSVFGRIPRSLPSFHVPAFAAADLSALAASAVAIAMLAAIESLLSAVVADGMTGRHHNSNRELIGQGLANIVAPMFGGFASTGAIARTATNVKNGGDSRLAGVVHALTLVLIMAVFAPYAAHIPLGALAAILFVIAFNVSECGHFIHLVRTGERSEVAVMLVTFSLTLWVNLAVGVNVGVLLAALLFMRRMADSVQVVLERPLAGRSSLKLPPGVAIYAIEGPFFFGAAETFERTMTSLQGHIGTLILRLDHVPFMDATAVHAFDQMITLFQRRGTRLVLTGLDARVHAELEAAGLLDKLGRGNIFASVEGALAAPAVPT